MMVSMMPRATWACRTCRPSALAKVDSADSRPLRPLRALGLFAWRWRDRSCPEGRSLNSNVVLRVKGTFMERLRHNWRAKETRIRSVFLDEEMERLPLRRSWSDGDLPQLQAEAWKGSGSLCRTWMAMGTKSFECASSAD